MNRRKIEETVEKLVTDIISGGNNNAEGYSGDIGLIELVDVEYVKERDFYLRVFLDKENSIEIEDCQWISERLEKKLDEMDLIKDPYYLEVSSPGLDRHLKKERDFARHVGDMVEIKLYEPIDGNKIITGKLLALADGVISIDANINDKPSNLNIPMEKTAYTRLHIDFKESFKTK